MLAAGAAGAATLAGCAAPEVGLYADEKPVLDLRQYFNGTLDAWGVFSDRSGKVVRRFTVLMDCRWSGPPGAEEGVLDEAFTYSDGEKQRRIWRLKAHPGGRFTGTADDVVGQAEGRQSGNAFSWRYTLALPVDGRRDAGPPQGAPAPSGGSAAASAASVGARVWHVDMDDWMYLMNERVMLNKAVMSKFGLKLGEVTLSFSKR